MIVAIPRLRCAWALAYRAGQWAMLLAVIAGGGFAVWQALTFAEPSEIARAYAGGSRP